MKISPHKIKLNPDNPRFIRDESFNKLVQSIKDFPEMLELRPIVVNEQMVVLGGNMRLRACKEAGLKEVPYIVAHLTEQEEKEFIIKDNIGFGDWDWDLIANEWEVDLLDDWGLDVSTFHEIEPTNEPINQYDDNSKWYINIEMNDESDCQKWYEKLISEGLVCKIIQ